MTKALTNRAERATSTTDILADFGKFLRLHTADGDASPATIRSYHSNAGQFVAWCAEHGINPATATEDDIATYRRELVAQYEVWTVAVKLAGLTVDSVDFDVGTVRVTGRGHKVRTVYLTEKSAEALRAWLDIRVTVAHPGEPALFVSLDRAHRGGGMSARAIRYRVDSYLEALGLKDAGISCHSLRHSSATWARAGGAALDSLADMLGHADTSTTRIYAQVVNKMQENPAKFLEAVLTAQPTV